MLHRPARLLALPHLASQAAAAPLPFLSPLVAIFAAPRHQPQGVDLGLRSMAAAGAEKVLTCINSPTGSFTFAEPAVGGAPAAAAGQRMGTIGAGAAAAAGGAAGAAASDSFGSFLEGVQQTGVVPLQMPLFCAHQMGTCRLGETG